MDGAHEVIPEFEAFIAPDEREDSARTREKVQVKLKHLRQSKCIGTRDRSGSQFPRHGLESIGEGVARQARRLAVVAAEIGVKDLGGLELDIVGLPLAGADAAIDVAPELIERLSGG